MANEGLPGGGRADLQAAVSLDPLPFNGWSDADGSRLWLLARALDQL